MALAQRSELTVIALSDVVCATCGVLFSLPTRMRESCQETGQKFYCPSGHGNVYTETDAMRYKRWYKQEQKLRQEEFIARNKAEADLRRIQLRIQRGVCPKCKRSFPNLKAHMACKHPEPK